MKLMWINLCSGFKWEAERWHKFGLVSCLANYKFFIDTFNIVEAIEGDNLIFHSLTFARSQGKCWKPRVKPEVFTNFPQDLANVIE